MEFEYECGNFASSTGKQVSFVRVTNVSDVVKKSVNQLNESGFFVEKSNIPKNLLWVLLTGDKEGNQQSYCCNFSIAKSNTPFTQPACWQYSNVTRTTTNASKRFLVLL